jgi:hypothetical protein
VLSAALTRKLQRCEVGRELIVILVHVVVTPNLDRKEWMERRHRKSEM